MGLVFLRVVLFFYINSTLKDQNSTCFLHVKVKTQDTQCGGRLFLYGGGAYQLKVVCLHTYIYFAAKEGMKRKEEKKRLSYGLE